VLIFAPSEKEGEGRREKGRGKREGRREKGRGKLYGEALLQSDLR